MSARNNYVIIFSRTIIEIVSKLQDHMWEKIGMCTIIPSIFLCGIFYNTAVSQAI
jgi:hypothetical protein